MTDKTPPGPDRRGAWIGPAMRMAVRLLIVAGVAYGAHLLIGVSMDLANRLPATGAEAMQAALLLTALVVYALLIATPFVPGVEIGLALLLLRGASIAPAVYLATLAGLALAFCIGRFVPDASLVRLLTDLRLRRAAVLVRSFTAMEPHARQSRLEGALPRWLALPIVQYRYLTLALLLNLPGNMFMGGGGGLMMAAGISRLFSTRATILTIAIAVLPVPLMIWFFGPGLLT